MYVLQDTIIIHVTKSSDSVEDFCLLYTALTPDFTPSDLTCCMYFVGDHYNPCNKEHSDEPRTKERHVGDVIKTTIPDDSDTVTIDVKDYQVS